MFETVASPHRGKHIAYKTLPISIGVHAFAIGGVVIAALLNIHFPSQSPHVMTSYVLAPVDPPPPPPMKLASTATANSAATASMKDDALVAPAFIPDTIPIVRNVSAASILTPGAQGTDSGGSPTGSPDGVIGGVADGVPGGIAVADDGRVHIGRDKPLPLDVIDKEDPVYPENELGRRREATVILRYVIGTDGLIKDVSILQHAQQAAFDEAILDVLRRWRFTPLQKNGKAVEVVHELTVIFRLHH